MPRKRRNFTPEQKADIVRRHMIDKVPVSDLCEEYGLQPSVFHSWQLAKKDSVIADISEMHLALKKTLGEP